MINSGLFSIPSDLNKVSTILVCLYQKGKICSSLYVDDGLVITKDTKLRDNLIAVVRKNFAVTIGDSTFADLHIERNKDGIFIHQSSYCHEVIERFAIADCAPVDQKVKLRKSDADPFNVPFR